MNKRLILLSLAQFLLTGILPLQARYPQALGPHIVDAVTVGNQGFAINNQGPSGREQILRTTDGWLTASVVHTAAADNDQFLAIATDGTFVLVSGTDGVIHRADALEDPEDWQIIDPGFPAEIRGLAHHSGTWIAVGDTILRSTNAGLSWTQIQATASLNAVTFSGTRWVAVGGMFDGEAVHSGDGGPTWSSSTLPANTPPLHAVTADGFGYVLAVGEEGTALLSTDNGASFQPAPAVDRSETLRAVVSTGENQWWIGGDQQTLLNLDGTGLNQVLSSEKGGDIGGLWLGADGELLLSGVEVVHPPQIQASDDPDNPVEVILSHPGSAVLWYSLDGSDPRDPQTRTAYAGPFLVGGQLTLRTVVEQDGIFSPLVSQEILAGAVLAPFRITAIQISSGQVSLTQDIASRGFSFAVEYTEDLRAAPQQWQPEAVAIQAGDDDELIWTFPAPAGSPRFWRIATVPGT